TAVAGSSTVTLTGGSIPANGSCTVTVNVTSSGTGNYINKLAAGALHTSNGNNTVPAAATLIVTPAAKVPPTLSKSFNPATIITGGISLLTITLSNPNITVATLTAPLVDTLPAGMVISGGAGTTCVGG